MKLHLRCSSVTLLPHDPSGFLVALEVCDWREVWRNLLLECDESALREMLGDEEFEKQAKAGGEVCLRALTEFDARRKA